MYDTCCSSEGLEVFQSYCTSDEDSVRKETTDVLTSTAPRTASEESQLETQESAL